jgi:hypothetical protein
VPAATPKPPSLAATDILLGTVSVPAAAVNIQAANILDRRLFLPSYEDVSHPALKYLDQGDKGAVALTFDWTVADQQRVRLTGNPTSITFVAPPAGTWVAIEVVQDGTGGRVLPAFPAAVLWIPGGTLPTFVTTLNKKTLISGFYDGTDYLFTAAANA